MSENKVLIKYRVTEDAYRNASIYTFMPNIIFKAHFSHMAMALSRAEGFRQGMLDDVAHAFKKSLNELQNETVYFELDQEGVTNEYLRKKLKIVEQEKEIIAPLLDLYKDCTSELLKLNRKRYFRRKMHFDRLRYVKKMQKIEQ